MMSFYLQTCAQYNDNNHCPVIMIVYLLRFYKILQLFLTFDQYFVKIEN